MNYGVSISDVINKSVDSFLLIFLFFLTTGLTFYLYYCGGFTPTVSYQGIILLSTVYIGYNLRAHNLKPLPINDIYIQKFLLFLVFFIFWNLLSYLFSSRDQNAIVEIKYIFRSIMLCISLMVLLCNEDRLKYTQYLFIGAALFDVFTNMLTFVNFDAIPTANLLYTFDTHVLGRGAGYFINPNNASSAIIFLMIAGSNVVPKQLRLLFWFICGFGVLITFSRAGWVMWAVALVYLSCMKDSINFRSQFLPFLIAIGAWILYFSCYSFVTNYSSIHHQPKNTVQTEVKATVPTSPQINSLLNKNTNNRLHFIDIKVLQGDKKALEKDNSLNDRLQALNYAWTLIKEKPLLGHGYGFTPGWDLPRGPHNMYVMFLVEEGIIGLIVYLLFLYILWSTTQGIGRLIVIEIGIESLVSHNILESPLTWLMISFALIYSYYQCKINQEKLS